MSNDECDLMIAVAARPGRRMMVADLKATRLEYRCIPALVHEKYLVYFEGGLVAVTDGGYAAMIKHCAHNF